MGWAGTPQFGLNSGLGLLSRLAPQPRPTPGAVELPDPTLARPAPLQPRARPALPPPQTGFSALLGSVGTSPFDSPVSFFLNWGFYFAGKSRRGGGFLPLPARAPGFPAPKAGGCPSGGKWGQVHPHWRCMRSEGTGFPRLHPRPAPLPPRAPAPRPSGRPATAGRETLQSHPGRSGVGATGSFTSPRAGVRKLAGEKGRREPIQFAL